MEEIKPKHSLKEILPKKDRKFVPAPEEREFLADPYSARATGNNNARFWLIAISVILFVVIAYYISLIFAVATVKVTPKQTSFELSGEFDADREAGDETVQYGTVSKIIATDSRNLKASGSEIAQIKAHGRALLINNFSQTSQQLVVNTRLATADGKIYRLDRAVTIPGLKKVGTTTQAGTVEIDITADVAGPSYNLDKADFRIVGFKGTTKYEKIYAKSVGAITGGFSGPVKKVNPEERATAQKELRAELTKKVIALAQNQISKDFILFDDGVFINFTEEMATGTSADTVNLVEKADLSGIIFNRLALSKYLAKKFISNFNSEEDVEISNLAQLNFKLLNKDKLDITNLGKISFSLDGKAKLFWVTNLDSLKTALKGASKNNKKVFADYPGIERAETSITPPWIFTFPANTDKIRTILELK